MSRERLAELAEVHDELKRLLEAIEVETGKPAPDMVGLSAVRLKLTQASRRRAGLVNTLVAEHAGRFPAEAKVQLEGLRQDLQQARFASAEHIGQWTTRAITKDWAGYCAASAKIRTAMRTQMAREATLLQSLPTA